MEEKNNEEKKGNNNQKTRRRVAVTILLLLVLIAAGTTYHFWHRAQIYVATDDAYVQGNIHLVSSRVSGNILEVAVKANQPVNQGDLLVGLDPATFEVNVRDATAALEITKTEVDQIKAAVKAADARLSHARATLDQADLDFRRVQDLVTEGVASKENLDKVRTARDVAAAGVKASSEELNQARAALGSTAEGAVHPLIQKRQAELEQAELELSYAKIYSPARGYVTQKNAEVGNRVQPGQPLMSIVPLDDVWVVANYKETQLKRVKVGQPVEITVDTYPGLKLKGRVESIMAGAGAVFSLFPPENATGNFVKVVQRIPVKIVLEENPNSESVLRMGMSVVPTIDTTVD